jgi:hypothetical protein
MLPDKLFEQMDQLIELELKKIELLRQLKKAYMLANVIGQHPNQIKGKLTTAVHTYVRLDGEEVARKKLIDVPLDLWPEDIRAEYERQQKRNKGKAHAQV